MLPPNEDRHDGHQVQRCYREAEGKAVEDVESCQNVVPAKLGLVDGVVDARIVCHAQAGVVHVVWVQGPIWKSGHSLVVQKIDEPA